MKRILEDDLSAKNSILLFPNDRKFRCILSGLALIEAHTHNQAAAKMKAVAELISEIKKVYPAFHYWLLVCQETWQPNTAIVKRFKLWRSSLLALELPFSQKSSEYSVEGEEGIKYFGFIECSELDFGILPAVIANNSACTLIAFNNVNSGNALSILAKKGWHRNSIYSPAPEMLNFICEYDVILFELIGRFDDKETGCAIICQKKIMSLLTSEFSA